MDVVKKNAKRKRFFRRALAVTIMLTLLTVATVAVSRLEPAPPSVEGVMINEVQRGTMIRDVMAYGSLVPIDKTLKTAESNGRIVELPLKPGSIVEPDTVIVRMDNPELHRELDDAKWALKSAEATVTSQTEVLKNQLLDLQSLVDSIEGELRDAEIQVSVDQQLIAAELIPMQRLRLSKGKRDRLQKKLETAKGKVKNFEASREPQLEVFRAAVAQAKALQSTKELQLANLEVKAGVRGILQQLGETNPDSSGSSLSLGQWVVSGSPLAIITDPTNLQAELRVDETKARDILLGQPVEIDARVAKIKGTVVRIDPAVSQNTVKVDVRLDGELPQGARPDLSVNGTILIEKLEDVLFTGNVAYGNPGSTVELFKVRSDGQYADRVRVTLGVYSVRTVQITDGLTEGDRIVASQVSGLEDSDVVRLD